MGQCAVMPVRRRNSSGMACYRRVPASLAFAWLGPFVALAEGQPCRLDAVQRTIHHQFAHLRYLELFPERLADLDPDALLGYERVVEEEAFPFEEWGHRGA